MQPSKLSLALTLALVSTLISCATSKLTPDNKSRVPAQTGTAAAGNLQILLLSDIHFDPYFVGDEGNPLNDPHFAELDSKDYTQWDDVFQKYPEPDGFSHEHETTPVVLENLVKELKGFQGNFAAAIITGDYISHGFKEDYEKHFDKNVNVEAKFKVFLQKTMNYLAMKIQSGLPNVPLVPVIGNNDSDNGDYTDVPNSYYLTSIFWNAWHFKQTFGPQVQAAKLESGYYTVNLQLGAVMQKVIVLNSTYWSNRYEGESGPNGPGQQELGWLERQLESAQSNGEKVWLTLHIPTGMDVKKLLAKSEDMPNEVCDKKQEKLVKRMLLDPDYSEKYVNLLHKYHDSIGLILAGHTHRAEFRVLLDRDSSSNQAQAEIVTLITPGITPQFGNDPGFKILDVAPQTGAALGETLYGMDLQNQTWSVVSSPLQEMGPEITAKSAWEFLKTAREKKSPQASILRNRYNVGAKAPSWLSDWATYACAWTSLDAEELRKCSCDDETHLTAKDLHRKRKSKSSSHP